MNPPVRTVSDIDGFITMLRAACDDPAMNRTLRQLLSQPDARRQDMVRWLVNDMAQRRAPRPLVQAVACLADDAVAQRAFGVICGGARN